MGSIQETRAVPRLLEGKLAVVTGAPRGIGAAIVRHLGAKGCNILGTYTSESSTEKANKLVEELTHIHGVKAAMVKADLSEPEKNAPLIAEAAVKHFGDAAGKLQVDILINNAGTAGMAWLGDVTTAEFNRMFMVNTLGPIMVTQAILPYLPNDRSGRIVNISSVASTTGFPTQTLYGGTKGALEAMTRTWARELAERATVNSVNPGPVEGDMFYSGGEQWWNAVEPFQLLTPLSAVRDGVDDAELVKFSKEKLAGRRPAYYTEVAAVVGMLCSEDSAWCTGSVVNANGGFKFGF